MRSLRRASLQRLYRTSASFQITTTWKTSRSIRALGRIKWCAIIAVLSLKRGIRFRRSIIRWPAEFVEEGGLADVPDAVYLLGLDVTGAKHVVNRSIRNVQIASRLGWRQYNGLVARLPPAP